MAKPTRSRILTGLLMRGVNCEQTLYFRVQHVVNLSLTFVTFVRKLVAPGAVILAFVLAANAARAGSNPSTAASIGNRPSASPEPFQSQRVKTGLKAALSESQVDNRLHHLANLAASLSLAEIPDALKAADDLKELRERMVFKQSLWQRWGELAPEDAFSHLAPLPESQWKLNTLRGIAAQFAGQNPERAAAATARMSPGISRNDTITLVARLWAQTNVNNALAWAEKLPDGYAKASALDGIRYVWVHSDPVAASKDVEKLPPGTTRNNLILNIAFEWTARDPAAAIRWVNRLPDGRDKDEALAGIAESWANQDPRAACAFALSLPPGEVRSQAGAMAAGRWARQNPREAAAWAWNCGDAGVRERGLKQVFEVWAGVDPSECAGWLEKLPPGPTRDQAARSFVTAATMWAPDIAARESLLIENEAIRAEAVNECLPRWLEVDLISATNWLNEAKLPSPLKARWRQTTGAQSALP